MNLVFIYLGEECLVIIYSASELAMGIIDVILQPGLICYTMKADIWVDSTTESTGQRLGLDVILVWKM